MVGSIESENKFPFTRSVLKRLRLSSKTCLLPLWIKLYGFEHIIPLTYYASFFVKHQGRQIYQSQGEKADWLSAPSNCNIFYAHILFLWPLLNNLWARPGPTFVSIKTSTYCSTARICTLVFCSASGWKVLCWHEVWKSSGHPAAVCCSRVKHRTWVCVRDFLLLLVDYTTLLKSVSVRFWAMG